MQKTLDRTQQVKLIGSSSQSSAMLEFISAAAASDATVLLEGESGTGKELMARAIHHASSRNAKSFVAINCGAINSNLIESELFGHEKGAFTGAGARRLGHFERANGGTLLLDEIGELSLPDQVKLLRALQEHRIQRVGGTKEIEVDVRVIAATNRDLLAELRAGNFRLDLYYRLAVMVFTLLPLRDRREDILPLARHFLCLFSNRMGRSVPKLTLEAEVALMEYPWPGNIREIENVIERTLAFHQGEEINTESLFFHAKFKNQSAPETPDLGLHENGETLIQSNVELDDLSLNERREVIKRALRHCYGNRESAARLLGLSSRYKLYRVMKDLGISAEIKSK